MARRVLDHLAEMRAKNPTLQAEYERLGPRFAVIDQLIAARQRSMALWVVVPAVLVGVLGVVVLRRAWRE